MRLFGLDIKRAGSEPERSPEAVTHVVEPVSAGEAYNRFVMEANRLRRGMWVSQLGKPSAPWPFAGILTGMEVDGTARVTLVDGDGMTLTGVTVPVAQLRQAWLDEIPAKRLPEGPAKAQAMGYRRKPK